MPNDVKERLEKRKKDIEDAFQVVKARMSENSKAQSELQTKLVQLQGAHQEVSLLLEEPEEEKKSKK